MNLRDTPISFMQLRDEMYRIFHINEVNKWEDLFHFLGADREYKGKTYAGLFNAPAGKGNHHSYKGGLCNHLFEMYQMYQMLCTGGFPIKSHDPATNKQSVMRVILLHDLHKAYYEFTMEEENGEVRFEYGDHPSSRMITNDIKSLQLANKFGITLSLMELNALFNSEGGYARNPPKYISVLAKLVYLLDEMSSNILDRLKTETILNVKVNDADDLEVATYEL